MRRGQGTALALLASTSRACSSSCTGGCSGSCDGRAGRRAPTRSPPMARRPRPRRSVRETGARPRDAALEFAWSTAATLEPWVDGANFFPRIFADVEAARLVGAHPHVRLAGGRGGDADGRPARAEAGRGRRGAGHRRRARLPAVHAGARDVHAARRGGRGDRRQRRPPARPGRPLPCGPRGVAPGPARPRRPSQAVRDRRERRLDGRSRHRGPLRRRPLPRPDGAGHR